MKRSKYKGLWWLPDQTDKWSGEVSIEGGVITLSLLGCTLNDEAIFEIPIIQGISEDGKKLTLFKNAITLRRMSFPGISLIEMEALYLFKGAHMNENGLYFHGASIEINSLANWIGKVGFQNYEYDNKVINVKYSRPSPICFYENENVRFSFAFRVRFPFSKNVHELSINQTTAVYIDHKSSFNFTEFWDYLYELKGFLTLAYFSEPQIRSLQLEKDGKEIEVQYATYDNQLSNDKSRHDFLINYSDIEQKFNHVYNNWHRNQNNIQPVLGILQESFSKKPTVQENKFFNIVQAVETFHRRLRKNERESSVTFKEKINDIISSVHEEHKRWVSEKLTYTNEPTLKERLEGLFTEIDKDLVSKLFPNVSELIRKARDTRNYYTHYDKRLENKALKGEELFFLTERLRILLIILILKEIGIEAEQLNKIINRGLNYHFNHLLP